MAAFRGYLPRTWLNPVVSLLAPVACCTVHSGPAVACPGNQAAETSYLARGARCDCQGVRWLGNHFWESGLMQGHWYDTTEYGFVSLGGIPTDRESMITKCDITNQHTCKPCIPSSTHAAVIGRLRLRCHGPRNTRHSCLADRDYSWLASFGPRSLGDRQRGSIAPSFLRETKEPLGLALC